MWRISLTLSSQKGPPLKRRIASSTQTINCNFNNSSPAPSGNGAVCIPPTVGVARRCHFRCSGAGSACKRSDSNPPPLPTSRFPLSSCHISRLASPGSTAAFLIWGRLSRFCVDVFSPLQPLRVALKHARDDFSAWLGWLLWAKVTLSSRVFGVETT